MRLFEVQVLIRFTSLEDWNSRTPRRLLKEGQEHFRPFPDSKCLAAKLDQKTRAYEQ